MSNAISVEKSVHASVWQGSTKLVNVPKVSRMGWWYVAEYRITNMLRWIGAVVAFGLGNPILYLLSVGIGIGALVDQNSGGQGIGGVPYLTFLAPALLATAAIQAAQDETSFPILQGFVWEKGFFAINSTPMTGNDIVNGTLVAAMVRCVLTTGLYEGVLLAFGAITWDISAPLFFASIFAGLAFGSMMLAVSSFVKEDDGFFAIVGRFILAPMFMFSGTFYPLEGMPFYLQWVGWISPLWHATDLGRIISYGQPQLPWVTAIHIVYLAVWAVAGLLIAYPQFRKRLSA